MFELQQKSTRSAARRGVLTTAHGAVPTPFFMTVATQGVAKHITTEELRQLGAPVALSNTYHLLLRPGIEAIKRRGGLHQFMDWQGPILTDSGGFQVFSLAGVRPDSQNLVRIKEDGVHFNSPWDGSKQYLTPELSLDLQAACGVDIAVCLDQCLALPSTPEKVKQSVERTTAWAKRAKLHHEGMPENKPLLFAVVQGGLDIDWRRRSLADLVALDFDGYNIGGLSVGETAEEMYRIIEAIALDMPEDKTRYLMGVGYPDNIVEAVKRGVDMFDCVIPTREGRHGRLFFWQPDRRLVGENGQVLNFYRTENIKNSQFAEMDQPINPESRLPILRRYTLAYLHYLYKIDEPLGRRLASLNNLEFYYDLMIAIREAIASGQL
ncbi:MAG TPA: tRNA guanosine(34) transglycosylase Tgt [bacterium]|nr:tRNA guanosine(34) transglycosylase Tgt [bacterium]